MVQGMGSLMDLCPAPDIEILGDLCEKFGKLPSDIKDTDDWAFLWKYSRIKALKSWYEAWNRMVAQPELKISMPMDLIQYMRGLMEEAKERYGIHE